MRPDKRLGVFILIFGLVLTLGRVPLLRASAAFLMLEDPLEPAAAIVVLGGGLPFRALEAAEIYHGGWAPRVVLTRPSRQQKARTLHWLGIRGRDEAILNRAVLIEVGVPASAIHIVAEPVGNTQDELQTVLRALDERPPRIILVTSKVHTRRVELIWHHLAEPESKAIVRAARLDGFDAGGWWSERASTRAVIHEYLGLVNYAIGSPLVGRTE